MALEGTIKEFGLADIFQLIGLQKKTGVLFLKGVEGTINIHFEDGMVVKVENSMMSPRYLTGTILINRGKINEAQLREALQIQKSTGQKLGQALIGQGLINKDELRDALNHQMCENVYSAFRWRGGDYKFYQDKVDYDRNTIIPINFENILMDGVRLMDEWPRIEKKLPSKDIVLKKAVGYEVDEDEDTKEDDIFAAPDGKGSGKAANFTREASAILKMVDGNSSVYEIIESSSLGEFETCKAIVELLDKGIVIKTGDRPQILSDRSEPLTLPVHMSGPLKLAYYPYIFIILSLLLIVFQVTGTRKVMSAGAKGLGGLKAPMALNQVKRVYNNSVLYYMDFGNYPADAETLVQLDYINGNDSVDPWGSKLQLSNDGNNVHVSSAGLDRAPGTSDDISSMP
ncbi:MAG: DUF4388 domain-containing protein [Nitrospirae bacterium]|nr:DUF4388 domain-containing protein [Nitrospirota bacterium]